MKPRDIAEIGPSVNLIVNEAQRRLHDKRTNVFILVTIFNVFMWGLMLAEYRQMNERIGELIDSVEVYKIMVRNPPNKDGERE